MSIIDEFKFITPPGKKFIRIDVWIKTLSVAEQEEFCQAKQRQVSYRQEKINEGNLIVSNDRYIWKDQEAATINKTNDKIWQYYFERYLAETGIKFEIIKIVVE